MKKMLKKVATILLAVMLVTVVVPANADAASKVIVHVQDGAEWGNVNIYNWGDAGETVGVWPGTPMEADSVDGWFTYTVDTKDVKLNLVFNNGAKLQSGDVKDIDPSTGECWIVIGGKAEENDMGAAATTATLYTEAEEGWPVAAAAVEATAEETTEAATTDAEPATGDTTPVLVVSIAALTSIVVFVASKKRKIA